MTDDLDRVLEGLGRVEASLGLEGRVLRAMEAPREWRFAWRWVGVVASVLVGVLVWGLVPKKPQAVRLAAAPAVVAPTQRTAEVVGEVRAVRVSKPAITAPLRVAVIMGQPDVMEAGFPAPPEPLTEQEKLLLRLARRPNEATVAMFDPKIREERAAAEKAEFEFFNPQPAVITAEPEEIEHVGKPGR